MALAWQWHGMTCGTAVQYPVILHVNVTYGTVLIGDANCTGAVRCWWLVMAVPYTVHALALMLIGAGSCVVRMTPHIKIYSDDVV